MTLHVVMGPPCSGKSTFVELHAPRGTPRFDFDRVAAVVDGTGELHPETVRGESVLNAVAAMRRGFTGWVLDTETGSPDAWIISGNPPQSLIAAYAGAGAEFHLLDPGMDVCLQRARDEGRPAYTEEAIRAWYENPPTIPTGEKGGTMKLKQLDFTLVKSDSSDDLVEGEFIGYASVFGNIDSYGDVVARGAFADALKELGGAPGRLPVLYGHDFHDPFSNIGEVLDAVEDDHGLKVHARLDLDNPKAAQVYRLIKAGRLSQMSFAYDVLDGGPVDIDGRDAYEIRRVKLYEVSVVPIGANQDTEIVGVKNAPAISKDDVMQLLRDVINPPVAEAEQAAPSVDVVDSEGKDASGDVFAAALAVELELLEVGNYEFEE